MYMTATHTVKKAKERTNRATLNLDEAAALLGLSRGATYAAANRGEIPMLRIGKRMLVPRLALEKMLAGPEAA